MEDAHIIELYWKRDPGAIRATGDKYGSYCFSVARNILGSREDSEECVNDTWLAAWSAMPPHRPTVLRMFLAKITRSLAFNRYKALSAQKRGGGETDAVLEELAECLAEETDVEDTLIAEELGETVRKFIRELPERERDIFLRRYFFTETLGEIGVRCGLTPNHVAVLLSRTRQKLKKQLIEEGYFHE